MATIKANYDAMQQTSNELSDESKRIFRLALDIERIMTKIPMKCTSQSLAKLKMARQCIGVTAVSAKLMKFAVTLEEIKNDYKDADHRVLVGGDIEAYAKYLADNANGELSEDDIRRIKKTLDELDDVTINKDITEEDREKIRAFNDLYEKTHPEEAKKLKDFFDGAPDNIKDHIDCIKYIAYNSEGDAHDLFFKYIDQCKVIDWNYSGGICRYNSSNRGVYINFTPENTLEGGVDAYNTFFHEIGHNIDDLMANGYNDQCDMFSQTVLADGKFHDVLYKDVENNFKEAVLDYSKYEATFGFYNDDFGRIDSKGQQKIVDVLMGRKDSSTLNYREFYAYNNIYEDYTGYKKGYISGDFTKSNYDERIFQWGDEYGNGDRAQITDIYVGTVENNSLVGAGHGIYVDAVEQKYYWHDANGNPTYKQNSEFFAEYFAYKMTKDPDMETAKKYFPEAYKTMDDGINKFLREHN